MDNSTLLPSDVIDFAVINGDNTCILRTMLNLFSLIFPRADLATL